MSWAEARVMIRERWNDLHMEPVPDGEGGMKVCMCEECMRVWREVCALWAASVLEGGEDEQAEE